MLLQASRLALMPSPFALKGFLLRPIFPRAMARGTVPECATIRADPAESTQAANSGRGAQPSSSRRDEASRVIYIGQLPHGFYEEQLKGASRKDTGVLALKMTRPCKYSCQGPLNSCHDCRVL